MIPNNIFWVKIDNNLIYIYENYNKITIQKILIGV